MNASTQERSEVRAAKLLIALLATACSLATGASAQVPAPPILLAPTQTSVIPIPGGSAGQAGATGWQHTGVTLRNCESYVNGVSYVLNGTSTPLTVDSCDFHDKQVRISGNVTLKRSRVKDSSGCDTACATILITSGAGPVLIEDVEITTTDPNAVGGGARQDRSIGILKGNTQNVILRRVYTHETMRGLDITGQQNITIEDSYLGPNVSPPTGKAPGVGCPGSERQHASAIRAAGGVRNLRLNNTVLRIGACSWASGLIATYPENGNNSDIIVDGGRWIIEGDNDGAYGIAAGTPDTTTRDTNSDFHVQNVQISTQDYNGSDGLNPGCPSGCAQNWNQVDNDGISTWTGNTKYNPGRADDGQMVGP